MSTLAVQGARAGSGGKLLLLALGASLLVHVVVYRSMARAPAPPRLVDTPVEVQWLESPAKPQPDEPAAKPGPRVVPRPAVKVVRRGPARVESAPAPVSPRPAPPAPEPARPPPPERVGINFASTVAESSFVVPVGTTLSGAPPPVAAAAAPAHAAAARYARPDRRVAFDQVSEPPVLLAEVRAAYPEAARTAGITGEVVLLLTIDASGAVAEARRLSGPGHGLDEAALAAIWRFRFRPARLDGEAVATVIRYIYSFAIN